MTITMTWRLVGVTAAAALLAACGSQQGASSTSGAGSSPGQASASASASLTCTDYRMNAAHMSTFVHYVALNVGTTNDSSTYYPQMDEAMAVLTGMTPTCAPTAVAPMAAFSTAVAELKATTKPGTDAATIAVDKAALAKVRAAGIAAWTAIGMPTAGWENKPEG